jgi:hypothetical protein
MPSLLVPLIVLAQLTTPVASAATPIAQATTAVAPTPAPQQIKPEPVAAAAKHPGPLMVEEEATSELSKGFGDAIWAATIHSADGSFGHADVLLVGGGSFLSQGTMERFDATITAPEESMAAFAADLERQLGAATHEEDRTRIRRELTEFKALQAGKIMARRIPLPGGDHGYVGLLGFGPVGATFVAAFRSPDRRYDLIVLTGGGLESARRTPTAQSQEYERAMRGKPLDVTEAIGLAVYAQLFPR